MVVIATAQATAWRPRRPRCPLSFRAVSSALSLLCAVARRASCTSLTVHRQAPAGAGVFVPSRLLCRSWLTTGFCRPSAPWRLPRAAASPLLARLISVLCCCAYSDDILADHAGHAMSAAALRTAVLARSGSAAARKASLLAVRRVLRTPVPPASAACSPRRTMLMSPHRRM